MELAENQTFIAVVDQTSVTYLQQLLNVKPGGTYCIILYFYLVQISYIYSNKSTNQMHQSLSFIARRLTFKNRASYI